MFFQGAIVIKTINSKTEWSWFSNIKTADELKEYFDERTKGHKEFLHYTSLGAINAILKSNTFRISSSDRFNDKKDSKQFGNIAEQKKHYSLCFSSGSNENLSLWYLYSGVDGKGGRIGFTYSKINKMIKDGEFYLTEYDYDSNKSLGTKILLKENENMILTFRDVLYSRCAKNSAYADLKYNTMTNHGKVKVSEYKKYKAGHIGFNKSLVWYYEKESRLLIKLISDAAEMIDPNKDYAVLWKMPENLFKQMKIVLAPEIEDKAEIENYEHIKDFIFNSSKVCLSENAGNVKMNICSKCDYKNHKENICPKCKKN